MVVSGSEPVIHAGGPCVENEVCCTRSESLDFGQFCTRLAGRHPVQATPVQRLSGDSGKDSTGRDPWSFPYEHGIVGCTRWFWCESSHRLGLRRLARRGSVSVVSGFFREGCTSLRGVDFGRQSLAPKDAHDENRIKIRSRRPHGSRSRTISSRFEANHSRA